jgi:hypothetical protein
LCGIDGCPVRLVDGGTLRAWVSTVERRAITPSVERAREHDDVVRVALGRGTPVPARFGQVFADDEALLQSLRERSRSIVSMLERVQGCVEMRVHLRTPPAERSEPVEGTSASPGRTYLEGLAHRERVAAEALRRAKFLQEQIALAAKDLIRATAPATYSPSVHAVSLSHLIAREAVPSYRHALRGVTEESAIAARAVVSGPWAPYSFVELRHD